MTEFNMRTSISLVATAALVAFGVTLFGGQAVSRTSGAKDPTAPSLFDKVSVGGRAGCEIQSWPYVAQECLTSADGREVVLKPVRRL